MKKTVLLEKLIMKNYMSQNLNLDLLVLASYLLFSQVFVAASICNSSTLIKLRDKWKNTIGS